MSGLPFAIWLALCLAEAAALWGFWLAGAWYVQRALPPASGSSPSLPDTALELLTKSIGLAFGLGLHGLIASWGYYLGIMPQLPILASGLLGSVLAIWLRGQRHLLLSSGLFRSKSLAAKLCLGLFACSLLIHLARVPLPWYDQDEITVYGFLAKAIAQGWTFLEVTKAWTDCVHYGPKLVESLDAQLIFLSGDIWLVRLSRLIGLAVTGLICAGTLAALGAPLAYCWAVAAAALTTPELMMYLGVSLKVDAAVMLFDAGAVCVLALAWLAYLPEQSGAPKATALERRETALRRGQLAFLLALFASAGRQSGLYAAILCGASILWFAWPRRDGAPEGLPRRFALLALAGVLAGVGYWANWAVFGNPVYPFKAPWPLEASRHVTSVAKYRQMMNLEGPPLLTHLYLIPHLALGLELRNLPFPPYTPFPHALTSRGQAMNWLSPALFTILLWPLALRLRPALVLGGVFLAQFVIWCLGVHYSRLFLGSSMLMTILCGYLAWAQPHPGHNRGPALRHTALALLCLTLALTLPLGLRWSWLRFEGNPQQWFSGQGRFEYAAKSMSGFSSSLPMPTRTDVARMNVILGTLPKPVVGVASRAGNGMHVFFTHGFFVDAKVAHSPDALLLGPDNAAEPAPQSMRLAHASEDNAWRLYVRGHATPGVRPEP